MAKKSRNDLITSVDTSKFVLKQRKMIKTGTLKYYDPKKGFGFIREKLTNTEIFVHKRGLKYPAKEMDVVTFTLKRTPKGVEAIDVRRARLEE